MNDEEKILAIKAKIEQWLNAVYDVAKKPLLFARRSRNSAKVGGYTINDYINHVNNAITAHKNQRNPHKTTWSQVRHDEDRRLSDFKDEYQHRDYTGLTVIDDIKSKITPNWTTGKVSIAAINCIWLGHNVTIPAATVDITMDDVTTCVYLVSSYNGKSYSFNYSTLDSFYRDDNKRTNEFLFFYVDFVNKSITTRNILRFGEFELSKTPLGKTVPLIDKNTSPWYRG